MTNADRIWYKSNCAMPGWKDISRLSDSDEKKRAAAFEAQVMASLAKDAPSPTGQPPAAGPPTPSAPARNGIQITVTANNQTTHYANLEAVPAPVRQRILNAWFPAPHDGVPPLLATSANRPELPAPPTSRPRSRRFAQTLNLLLPGAGQIYLGQLVAGSSYALTFLGCFVAMLLIFFHSYTDYLQLTTGGDILEGDKLEQLTHAFPAGTLVGLLAMATVIYFASAIHLSRSHPRE
jgi:hypothetical protein